MKRTIIDRTKKTVVDRTADIPAPDNIQIERHVPIPPPRRGRRQRWPLIDMQVGESIEVLQIEADRVRTAAWNTTQRYGYQFTTRKTDKGVRIWRTA